MSQESKPWVMRKVEGRRSIWQGNTFIAELPYPVSERGQKEVEYLTRLFLAVPEMIEALGDAAAAMCGDPHMQEQYNRACLILDRVGESPIE